MSFRLVDTGWAQEFADAATSDRSGMRLICPFIKLGAVERLLASGPPGVLQVVTRFNLDDFARGVSDIEALRLLLRHGATIRGVRNLHAKLYLFGDRRVIGTSANLTMAAMDRNHEFGFVSESAEIIAECRRYFDRLWNKAGDDLTNGRLEEWRERVSAHLTTEGWLSMAGGLGDEGVDAGFSPETSETEESRQAFVKLFGESNNRADRSVSTPAEVRRSGSHWSCSYSYRQRQVEDGDLMFIARTVKNDDDIMVYGRAIAMRHVDGRDEATATDIAEYPWKGRWRYYVRVHDAKFVAGTLANGVSLYQLMDELGSDSLASTQRNALKSVGNTNPYRAYRGQAKLTSLGAALLNRRLQDAFERFGTLSATDLAPLYRPAIELTVP